MNSLSINIFELNFYQDQNKWKHKLIPTEFSRNESVRVVDLINYENHYALIKALNRFIGIHHKFICGRCLDSFTSENALTNHKEKCGDDNICTIKTSNESQIQWNKQFHKILLLLGLYADFEADNEIDNPSIGHKTTTI